MADIDLPDVEELREQGKNTFGKRVALVTAVFAVILAITSLGGDNAGKDMILAQQQISDEWAYYQSKATREHLYKIQKMTLSAEFMDRKDTMSNETKTEYEKLIKLLDDESSRYKTEKKDIEESAKRIEGVRDLNMAKDPYFDYAEVLLQLAIILASISILATSRTVFIISLGVAALGAFLSINGFLLLVKIPYFF